MKEKEWICIKNLEQAARNYASMSEDKGISESLRMARLAVSVAYRDAADEVRTFRTRSD